MKASHAQAMTRTTGQRKIATNCSAGVTKPMKLRMMGATTTAPMAAMTKAIMPSVSRNVVE